MTAIFAFAQDDIAFVAGDSRRTAGIGHPVCKLYRWSDQIVLAQSGSALFMDNLMGDMLKQMAFFPDLNGLTQVFKAFQPSAVTNANPKWTQYGPLTGTLLAAVAANGNVPAVIFEFDCVTGSYAQVPGNFAAAGTDKALFTQNAQKHMPSSSPLAGFQLDEWAAKSINDAVVAYPKLVGWPAYALITRDHPDAIRLCTQRHLLGLSATPMLDFAI